VPAARDGGPQELLERAARAQDDLESMTFVAEVSVATEGRTFGATVHGGGYLKGGRTGDMSVTLDLSEVPGAPERVRMVVKGGRANIWDGSGWDSMAVPDGQFRPAKEVGQPPSRGSWPR
jgi:hypothetical protein